MITSHHIIIERARTNNAIFHYRARKIGLALALTALLFFISTPPAHAAQGDVTITSITPDRESVIIKGEVSDALRNDLTAAQDAGNDTAGIAAIVSTSQDLTVNPMSGTVLFPDNTNGRDVSIIADGTFTDTISGLAKGTTYYLNYIRADRDIGFLLQSTESFTTKNDIILQLNENPIVTKNSAMISFNIDTNGQTVALKIKYGTTSESNLNDSTNQIWSGSTVSGEPISPKQPDGRTPILTGLASATAYYYNIINVADGTVYLSGTFTTLAQDESTISGNPYIGPINNCTAGKGEYCLIEPLPGFTGGKISVSAPDALGSYFNILFNLALGLGAVLAVVMIVIGGIQYMGTESVFNKGENKSRITNAVWGLLILLGCFIILKTINSDLLTLGPNPQSLNVKVTGADVSSSWDSFVSSNPTGKTCDAIFATATANVGVSTEDAQGTNNGNVACSFVVDTIIEKATGTYTSGGNCVSPELKTTSLQTELAGSNKFTEVADVTPSLNSSMALFSPPAIFQSSDLSIINIAKFGLLAKKGDIIISPTTGSISGHVGICNDGCANIISNSSSQHKVLSNFTFNTWTTDPNFKQLPLYLYRAKDCSGQNATTSSNTATHPVTKTVYSSGSIGFSIIVTLDQSLIQNKKYYIKIAQNTTEGSALVVQPPQTPQSTSNNEQIISFTSDYSNLSSILTENTSYYLLVYELDTTNNQARKVAQHQFQYAVGYNNTWTGDGL